MRAITQNDDTAVAACSSSRGPTVESGNLVEGPKVKMIGWDVTYCVADNGWIVLGILAEECPEGFFVGL